MGSAADNHTGRLGGALGDPVDRKWRLNEQRRSPWLRIPHSIRHQVSSLFQRGQPCPTSAGCSRMDSPAPTGSSVRWDVAVWRRCSSLTTSSTIGRSPSRSSIPKWPPRWAPNGSCAKSASPRLQHPHILTLIDSGEIPRPDGMGPALVYYVMPYVEG